MALSQDREKRTKQLVNLRQGGAPNTRHGAGSRVLLQPLIEEAVVWARERWPWLDDTRTHLVATLAARIRRVEMWAAENDILYRHAKHAVRTHPIVESCHTWERSLERLIERLDAEARDRGPGHAELTYEDVMGELAGRNGHDDAGEPDRSEPADDVVAVDLHAGEPN